MLKSLPKKEYLVVVTTVWLDQELENLNSMTLKEKEEICSEVIREGI